MILRIGQSTSKETTGVTTIIRQKTEDINHVDTDHGTLAIKDGSSSPEVTEAFSWCATDACKMATLHETSPTHHPRVSPNPTQELQVNMLTLAVQQVTTGSKEKNVSWVE